MADSPDHGAAGANNESGASASSTNNSVDRNLPMVVAPKLGAGADEPAEEAPAATASEAGAAAAPPPSPRFLMLAASVAFAAAFGSFVGSVSGSSMSRFIYPPAPTADAASAATSETLRAMKQQFAELVAIKADLETASRSTTGQFAKIADRLDRIDQHATAAAAAAETTGSIAAASSAPATASVAVPAVSEQPKFADRVLPDWVVQDVRSGRALVENRRGGMFDVGTGSVLPGLGRVAGIKRQDGQWMVVTESGTITSTGR